MTDPVKSPFPINPWPDTPEALISEHLETTFDNAPRDLIGCALLRAHAVTVLLGCEFSDPDRNAIDDQLVVNALWDIQGHLETAQHLLGQWEVAYV